MNSIQAGLGPVPQGSSGFNTDSIANRITRLRSQHRSMASHIARRTQLPVPEDLDRFTQLVQTADPGVELLARPIPVLMQSFRMAPQWPTDVPDAACCLVLGLSTRWWTQFLAWRQDRPTVVALRTGRQLPPHAAPWVLTVESFPHWALGHQLDWAEDRKAGVTSQEDPAD